MEDKKTLTLNDGSTAEYVVSTAQYHNKDLKTGREKGIEQYEEYRATITDAAGKKYPVKVFKNLTGEWTTLVDHEEGGAAMKSTFKQAVDKRQG